MTADAREIRITEKADGKVLEVQVTGKLEKSDYEAFLPKIEARIETHGKVRMLLYLHDFLGWTACALWEDLKFDLKHFNHIERLAIVGESKWEQGMAVFCKPFTTAKIKYFDKQQLPEARQWVEAGLASQAPPAEVAPTGEAPHD